MKKDDLLKLLEQLDKLTPDNNILLIDGFNLFMRNFTKINYLNSEGVHIGGLGGFLRSLGYLIKEFRPEQVYIIFDGVGSSYIRKSLIPEYKNNRQRQKLTNKNIFNSIDEENESKTNQIIRLIQYLKCLPIKILSIDKVEADDVISYLALNLPSSNNKIIVSSDNDFFQLISENIKVYRPQERVLYDIDIFKNKFEIHPENYIIYKTLIGDASDNIKGIKDLGPKTLINKFPEIKNQKLELKNIADISETKYQEHIIYTRILSEFKRLENTYKIMNLHNPLLDDDDKLNIEKIINEPLNDIDIDSFIKLYNNDGLINTIRNIKEWLRDFIYLKNKK